MQPKMFYICVICTRTKPPLIVMSADHRQILDCIASHSHHALLKTTLLMMCPECRTLVEALGKFQKTARVGIQNLIRLVSALEKPQIVEKFQTRARKLLRCVTITNPGEIRRQLKPHCIVIKKSQIFSKNLPKVDIKFVNGVGRAPGVPSVTKEPEVEIKTEPQSPVEACAIESKEITEELIIKEEACEPESVFEAQPDYEIQPDIESKPDIGDVPEFEANSGIEANPDSRSRFDPDLIDSESTDTCESDYGNDEDIILAALAKTNTPTLPYLKAGNTKTESYASAATKSNRRLIKSEKETEINYQSENVHWYMEMMTEAEVFAAQNYSRRAAKFVKAAHKCDSCVLVFKHMEELAQHAQCHEPSIGGYACHICLQRFITQQLLNIHISEHRNSYVCLFCQYTTTKVEMITKHACVGMRDGVLHRHSSFGVRVDVPCAFCNKVFVNKYLLRDHIQRVHFKNAKLHKCEVCGLKCKTKVELMKHKNEHKKRQRKVIKKKNQQQKPQYWCPREERYCAPCRRQLRTRDAFLVHSESREHAAKLKCQFDCDVCGAKFPVESKLKRHVGIVHSSKVLMDLLEPVAKGPNIWKCSRA